MEDEKLLAFSAVTRFFGASNPYHDIEECERVAGKYLLSKEFYFLIDDVISPINLYCDNLVSVF